MSCLPPENSIAVVRHDEDGGGQRVHHIYAGTVRSFTDGLVAALMDGSYGGECFFALGFASAINALSHDEIDWSRPVEVVGRAQADVECVTEARAVYTDVLRGYCERIQAGGSL